MGCCVSSNGGSTSSASSSLKKNQDSAVSAQPPRSSTSQKKASENREPPQVEEETVKEVLSETPRWNPDIANLEPEKPPQNLAFDKFEEESKLEKTLPVNKVEEISEVSEVCSLSEALSTTTITDHREEGQEISKRVNGSPAKMQKNRSFSGDFDGKRERTVGKSPARRTEQSPVARNVGSARMVQNRDQMGHTTSNGRVRNLPQRRRIGESSGRRSRSPATLTENGAARSVVSRSPPSRRTNRSPVQVRATPPESACRKMENPTMEGKWPSANESLENPLVSLECFIFI